MRRFVQTMLLLSLFFNIAHASIIAVSHSCDHETVHEYLLEIDHNGDCGDLCDMHHLFHLSAIPPIHVLVIEKLPTDEAADYRISALPSPCLDADCRPPISI